MYYVHKYMICNLIAVMPKFEHCKQDLVFISNLTTIVVLAELDLPHEETRRLDCPYGAGKKDGLP